MPYFERKPYNETLASQAKSPMLKAVDETPFEELARAVLAQESGPKHAMDGPFNCANPIAPGGSGQITLSFAASGEGPPLNIEFTTSDLHGPDGQVLPADLIDVIPGALTLRPGQGSDVIVRATVPADRGPGLYRGRVTALGSEPTAIVIGFTVA